MSPGEMVAALRRALLLVLLLTGTLALSGGPGVLGTDTRVRYALPARRPDARANVVLEQRMIDLVNLERTLAGVRPLLPDPALRESARAHGREMFTFGYLSHYSLDGRSVRDRLAAAGVRVTLVGENLAYATDVLAAHQALMASPAHRRNILSPVWRVIGVGVLDGGEDGVVVVQAFAR